MSGYIKALTLADKQKFAWLLTQLEASGVKSLPEGRRIVEEELRRDRLARKVEIPRRDPRPAPQEPAPCPECGAVWDLYNGVRYPAWGTQVVEGESISTCRVCRYSTMVEVGS